MLSPFRIGKACQNNPAELVEIFVERHGGLGARRHPEDTDCDRRSCALWSGRFAGLMARSRQLGRSQAVRQRILIPPYGGSNPPAPAKQSRECRLCAPDAQRRAFPGLFCGPRRPRDFAKGEISNSDEPLSRESQVAIFKCPDFSAPAERERFDSRADRVRYGGSGLSLGVSDRAVSARSFCAVGQDRKVGS